MGPWSSSTNKYFITNDSYSKRVRKFFEFLEDPDPDYRNLKQFFHKFQTVPNIFQETKFSLKVKACYFMKVGFLEIKIQILFSHHAYSSPQGQLS